MMTAVPSQRADTPRSHQIVLLFGLSLIILTLSGITTYRITKHHVERLTNSLQSSPPNCPYPIVYNKPHKTASTRIQIDLLRWAGSQKRPRYKCSPYIRQATMEMRECVPRDTSGCAVLATHVILSPLMRQIVEEKIGKFRLVTSTRDPRARIPSLYLQERHLKAGAKFSVKDLKDWLRAYNPWEMYNYHTGDNRHGSCPMSEQEKQLLPDLVNQADIVIDADLRNISNKILKKNGLFEVSKGKTNVRSSKDLALDEEAMRLLNNVSCVEDEIHRLFRLRMGSLYEQATGTKCLSNTRHPSPCF